MLAALLKKDETSTLYRGSFLGEDKRYLRQAFGFELQYDETRKKIIGIKMDSRITKSQIGDHIPIDESVLEAAENALLNHIDTDLIDESIWEGEELVEGSSILTIAA